MSRPKEKLGALIRNAGELFAVSAAATFFGISNIKAAKVLARWAAQGWLIRIRRGLYAVVPIEAAEMEEALEDEWMIITELFAPCYVAGWSAAEYWGFTEQVFRDICVMTEKPVQCKKQVVHNISFILYHIPNSLNFATKTIWKKQQKIQISDPHKTILDMLNIPKACGGIQHVIDCFREYIKSQHFDANQLAIYASQVNNGAAFKRLGFLSSKMLGEQHPLTLLCKKRLTKGNAYLDPSLKGDKLITKWRLFVPDSLQINGRE